MTNRQFKTGQEKRAAVDIAALRQQHDDAGVPQACERGASNGI